MPDFNRVKYSRTNAYPTPNGGFDDGNPKAGAVPSGWSEKGVSLIEEKGRSGNFVRNVGLRGYLCPKTKKIFSRYPEN